MGLKVIGAGFGRTGTASTKSALELLGFGPCHHMFEVNASNEQKSIWRAIAAGASPDWERAFKGFNSCTDWPAAFYWRELSAVYPDAMVLLTLRDAEGWYKSARNTIFNSIDRTVDPASLGVSLIAKQVFDNRLDDRDHAIAIYENHNATVKQTIAPDRLLVFDVREGWEPLCAFLGCDIPDTPFPRSNSTAEMNARNKDA